MPQTKIDSAVVSDVENAITSYDVDSVTTEAPTGLKEFSYQNSNWAKNLGYYKAIPELKIAVDTKANWVLGNGYTSDEWTTIIIDRIKGTGKDSFNSILENMERACYIGEDSYAEIILDKNKILINLKPLDPSSIKVIYNANGIILGYEQVSKNKKPNKKFKPKELFVLSHNRMADEVHGISVVDAVENIILMRNEAMSDWKRVLHRNIDPLWIFHLDTDDTTEIAKFKTKNDTARANGENMYVPKGVVVPEQVTTSANATLNPVTWINQLNDYFFQAVGVPQIIIGNAKEFTDASAKISYLAFEQRIRGRQTFVEEQVLNQLNLEIELIFPASMNNEAISDQPNLEAEENQLENGEGVEPVEEEPIQPAVEPNDKKAELEGRT